MSRVIAIAIAVMCASVPAFADTVPPATPAPEDISDQEIGGSIGVAGGGRVTPGGLRIIGHYLYQMTDTDWFDGTAAFTFGSGAPACYRDRMDAFVCEHGLTDGVSAEIGANVRRFLGGRDKFWPYVRLGVGVGIARFSDDDITGIVVPLHVGGGIRVSVAPGIAVIAEATLDVGVARFSHDLGLQPQIGGSVTAGAEFGL